LLLDQTSIPGLADSFRPHRSVRRIDATAG
jgi:hypothetical protein